MHQAADGPLARVRTPGGILTAPQLRELAGCARDLGSGVIELTSRANVQVRGLRDPAAFAARIAEAGLRPSATHERVRNIVAAPSVDGALVAGLDRSLCARPELAGLPGRFLFALGDTGLVADVASIGGRLLLAGHEVDGVPGTADGLLEAAVAFLRLRTDEWRVSELADGPARIAAELGGTPGAYRPPRPPERPAGLVEALVPLGRLTPEQALALAGLAERAPTLAERAPTLADPAERPPALTGPAGWSVALPGPAGRATAPPGFPGAEVRLSPRRTVLVADRPGAGDALEAAGLVTDPDSPWVGVTACAGRPGCARALADVRADAARWVHRRHTGLPVHWAGCERQCGLPPGRVVRMVATADGYEERHQ
ncbi:precorrin-3B synthase [Streptosporangium pseudovulgare]|uniref:precorrin-3B synthase n=1 Tax=Streptosporangium pseudovulgare TaxID=35765 RepID=UPI001E2989CD|nr:precorrin-3B synthase [Streptosporangium pseudovulgare]